MIFKMEFLNKKWISFVIFLTIVIFIVLLESLQNFNVQNVIVLIIVGILGVSLFFVQNYYSKKYPKYSNIPELIKSKYRWLYITLQVGFILLLIVISLFVIYIYIGFGLNRFV